MSRKYPRPDVHSAIIANAWPKTSEGSSDSKAAEAPAGNPADAGASPAPSTINDTEDPMIIKFTSVTLHKAMPRLDSGKGQATQETTFFDVVRALVTVELDTASQLVRIAKGNAVAYVPLAGVERFGPTVEDAARFATARAADAAKAAADATA